MRARRDVCASVGVCGASSNPGSFHKQLQVKGGILASKLEALELSDHATPKDVTLQGLVGIYRYSLPRKSFWQGTKNPQSAASPRGFLQGSVSGLPFYS